MENYPKKQNEVKNDKKIVEKKNEKSVTRENTDDKVKNNDNDNDRNAGSNVMANNVSQVPDHANSRESVCIQITGSHLTETETDAAIFDKNNEKEDINKIDQVIPSTSAKANTYPEPIDAEKPCCSYSSQSIVAASAVTLDEVIISSSTSSSTSTSSVNRMITELSKQENSSSSDLIQVEIHKRPPVSDIPRRLWSADDLIQKNNVKYVDADKVKLQHERTHQELQQIEHENKELAERFTKIVQMFNTFTRNLESIEPTLNRAGTSRRGAATEAQTSQPESTASVNLHRGKTTTKTGGNQMRSEHYGQYPRQHISRYVDYYGEVRSMAKDNEFFNHDLGKRCIKSV